MRLQSIIGIITTLSLASVGLAGCTTQQAQSNSDTPENSPIAQTQEATPTPQPQEGKPDVPYLPTPNEVVEAMLELAKVNSNDVLYDLGSGDGRIPITAAQKFGTRATGVEIDPYLVEKSRANAQQAGVADRVKFLQQDLFKTDLSDATVVTLYLLPHINLKLRPTLLRLKPGTRIVSHAFNMGDWKPDREIQVQAPGSTRPYTLYYWVVPRSIPRELQ